MTTALASKLHSCWQAFNKRASRAYVAGDELASAVRVCHQFAREGVSNTIAYWNSDHDAPRFVADTYLSALSVLADERLNSYLSIKAPALGLSNELVIELAEQGRRLNLGLHFDALGPEVADRTFELIAAARQQTPKVGCTLPGRWQRSLTDAEQAIQLGLRVRVVKGQWADPQQPELDPRAGFMAVIERLAGRAQHVAVATHDPFLACEAVQLLRASGTPCEIELLYGLPRKALLKVARALNVPVRLYVPYGEAWLPYRLSQVRRNPRVLWWVMRDALQTS
ncbi:MAG: proline dehydrogenase [Acidobacteria bacterium]|nr:proline dehydrogenase [Acidobacteriota bacterium]MBI3422573.1 proline dehydrogenase [Acidobacteriota bacterium]